VTIRPILTIAGVAGLLIVTHNYIIIGMFVFSFLIVPLVVGEVGRLAIKALRAIFR
jgi:hypothetical protein